jgi:hypothetical protein
MTFLVRQNEFLVRQKDRAKTNMYIFECNIHISFSIILIFNAIINIDQAIIWGLVYLSIWYFIQMQINWIQ